MKVLYVNEDRHENILLACANPENQNVYIIPRKINGLPDVQNRQHVVKSFSKLYPNHRYNLFYRLKLMLEIKKIADEENPDIIHFVSADEYVRLFGVGLSLLKKYHVILEMHWCVQSRMRNLSRKILYKKIDEFIFHVANIPKEINKRSEYVILPAEHEEVYSKSISRKDLNISSEKIVISMVGSMEKYKGVDILLKALQSVKSDFYLILGGDFKSYREEEIMEMVRTYRENVLLLKGYVKDEIFLKSICASDYVMIPYRKSFEATSGPMTEAIRCGVPIIASNHGNVGYLTKKYHLGYTFKAEDAQDLSTVLEKAITKKFKCDEKYNEYKEQISRKAFRDNLKKIYKKVIEG